MAQCGVAVVILVQSQDNETAAGQFDGIGILHFRRVQIAVGNDDGGLGIVSGCVFGHVQKTAQFTVQGVSKGSKSATVALVFPIYYGAGQSADVLNTDAMTAHSAIASPSFIQSITTADNDFIFFEVPDDMANIQRLQLWDDPSFPTDLSIESVETPREGYKAFKTVYTRLAGTHTYKVS